MRGGIKAFVLDHKLYCIYVPLFWILFVALILLFVNSEKIVPFIYRLI